MPLSTRSTPLRNCHAPDLRSCLSSTVVSVSTTSVYSDGPCFGARDCLGSFALAGGGTNALIEIGNRSCVSAFAGSGDVAVATESFPIFWALNGVTKFPSEFAQLCDQQFEEVREPQEKAANTFERVLCCFAHWE